MGGWISWEIRQPEAIRATYSLLSFEKQDFQNKVFFVILFHYNTPGFSLNPESAAGPDGYTGQFFQTAWPIISSDVILVIQEFVLGADIPKAWTATAITLIPKTSNPSTFSEYRPISLTTFINKIISKILAMRLEEFLPKLISKQQSGFVKGRNISDNILLAQELMSTIKKNQGIKYSYKVGHDQSI